jgi:hypothetical protein
MNTDPPIDDGPNSFTITTLQSGDGNVAGVIDDAISAGVESDAQFVIPFAPAILPTGNLMLHAWCRTTGAVASQIQIIAGWSDHASNTVQARMMLNSTLNPAFMTFGLAGVAPFFSALDPTPLSIGTWTFLVGVHDATNGRNRLYRADQGDPTPAVWEPVADVAVDSPIDLGLSIPLSFMAPANDLVQEFKGDVDNVGVWRNLSLVRETTIVAWLWNNGAGRAVWPV